jgi:hypothetical protein
MTSRLLILVVIALSSVIEGCRGSCENRLTSMAGSLPDGTRVTHCSLKPTDDVRYFSIEALLKSDISFESLAGSLKVRHRRMSLRESGLLGDWGGYGYILDSEYTNPRGGVREDNGYLVVLKEVDSQTKEIRIIGNPMFRKP